MITDEFIRDCVARSADRLDLWIRLIREVGASHVAEVGVYRGQFAAALLNACDSIDRYYMVDPWRHLDDWNKPANRDNDFHEMCFAEAKSATEFAGDKRVMLRGRTTEVIDQIPDDSLDLAYVDGDHTLRGISIDLIRLMPKVKVGGWIGGDDFHVNIWQHSTAFEPTLVFPFAVHFAEATRSRIYGLPFNQFMIEKSTVDQYAFIDLAGKFGDTSLRNQFHPNKFTRQKLAESFPFLRRAARGIKRRIA